MQKQTARRPEELVPLKPDVFAILLVVLDEPVHGYGIMQRAREHSAGGRELQTGALYRLLKRMLDDGLIGEVEPAQPAHGGDPRRRYYRATELGREVAAAEGRRMRDLVSADRLRGLLSETGSP